LTKLFEQGIVLNLLEAYRIPFNIESDHRHFMEHFRIQGSLDLKYDLVIPENIPKAIQIPNPILITHLENELHHLFRVQIC